MNTRTSLARMLSMLCIGGLMPLVLQSCMSVDSTQQAIIKTVKVDGSSTVYPITLAISKEFNAGQTLAKVSVNVSGTGGGFKKFCAGETDINNASRPIRKEEMEECNRAGVRFYELPIAYDALTVVVNANNSWAKDITIEELHKIWEPTAEGKLLRWNQVRPDWPDRPIKLYGPGKDSGTFDYFTEAIVGKAKSSRSDYIASEDDKELVNEVGKDANALGYFGFAYYESSTKELKALAINNGKVGVIPSRQTVEDATYQPLSRPLFIYVNFKSLQKPEVKNFVDFYLKQASKVVTSTGYIPLPQQGYTLAESRINFGRVGTIFGGNAQVNLTIKDLLSKELTF